VSDRPLQLLPPSSCLRRNRLPTDSTPRASPFGTYLSRTASGPCPLCYAQRTLMLFSPPSPVFWTRTICFSWPTATCGSWKTCAQSSLWTTRDCSQPQCLGSSVSHMTSCRSKGIRQAPPMFLTLMRFSLLAPTCQARSGAVVGLRFPTLYRPSAHRLRRICNASLQWWRSGTTRVTSTGLCLAVK
jgi:hypothetical protein